MLDAWFLKNGSLSILGFLGQNTEGGIHLILNYSAKYSFFLKLLST
jgi:hypothetical protein